MTAGITEREASPASSPKNGRNRRDTLRQAAERLERAGCETPRLDAECLLACVLQSPRWMVLVETAPLTVGEEERFDALVARRAGREPLAYITGEKEFWSLPFRVTPAVLIPRPETETVVERALRVLPRLPSARYPLLADVGTGSGAIGIALAREIPEGRVYATDISREALDLARENACRLGIRSLTFLEGDLAEPLRRAGLAGRLDLLVANLPYIPSAERATLAPEITRYEPPVALDGGPDGLRLVRRLIAEVPGLLAPGGACLLEVGDGQGEAVRECVRATPPLQWGEGVADAGGRERVAVIWRRNG